MLFVNHGYVLYLIGLVVLWSRLTSKADESLSWM
jgi:hypothetical protein